MSILETKDLSLTIEGERILDDLNIGIEEGQVQAIVGPNGAGKSSLAFSIMGLDGYRDVEGDILYKGESLVDLDISERADKGLALAWQEPTRYEGLTVEKFINAAGGGDGTNAEDVLEKVGMDPDSYLGRALDSGLSGGREKENRVGFHSRHGARTGSPGRARFRDRRGLAGQNIRGNPAAEGRRHHVVLITHSSTALEEAEYAFLMCHGKVVDEGDVEELRSYFEEKCIPCDHKNRPEQGDLDGS